MTKADLPAWIDEAKRRIVLVVRPGATFVLSDVFEPAVWKSLSANDRRALGRRFSTDVQNDRVPRVELSDNKSRGSNQYIYLGEEA